MQSNLCTHLVAFSSFFFFLQKRTITLYTILYIKSYAKKKYTKKPIDYTLKILTFLTILSVKKLCVLLSYRYIQTLYAVCSWYLSATKRARTFHITPINKLHKKLKKKYLFSFLILNKSCFIYLCMSTFLFHYLQTSISNAFRNHNFE